MMSLRTDSVLAPLMDRGSSLASMKQEVGTKENQ